MKYIKKYEARQVGKPNKNVYWLVPFDNRLEDSLVTLYKELTKWKTPVEPVDKALSLAKWIRDNFQKRDFIYIKYDLIRKDFSAFDWGIQELIGDDYYYMGEINIEEHELDARKYNL